MSNFCDNPECKFHKPFPGMGEVYYYYKEPSQPLFTMHEAYAEYNPTIECMHRQTFHHPRRYGEINLCDTCASVVTLLKDRRFL